MVTKEIVEKRIVEEGCLMLLGKKLLRNTEEQFFLRKMCFSSLFFSVSDFGQYQGLLEKGFAGQPGLRLPACELPNSLRSYGYMHVQITRQSKQRQLIC